MIFCPWITFLPFFQESPSGTVENKDSLCVLAYNIINEKIYIFLWFWFISIAFWIPPTSPNALELTCEVYL